MKKQTQPLSVLDTFAGAGGFSLGFQMAGCHIVGAIESDKWACETFAYNHPDAAVMQRDIRQFSDDEVISNFGSIAPDIIIGGPPCQGFSIANRNPSDPKDPRNSLFREFVRLGRLLKPRVMVMENVPNLLAAKTSDGKLVLEIIKANLAELDFHTYSTVLQATNYGVPQIRQRLFVIASRDELSEPFPTPTHDAAIGGTLPLLHVIRNRCPTLWDAISDLPELKAGEGGEEVMYTNPAMTEYQEQMRLNSSRLFNHKAMNHTKRMVERFASMECGHSVSDVPEHLKPRKRNSSELTKNAYDQNNRRMYPNRPCHTVPASFYANFVHPYQHRNFTAREGARIQSFPDWYRFMGKPTVVSHKLLAREDRGEELHLCQYNQIGNAVPPFLSRAIAANLIQQLKEIDNVYSRKQLRAKRTTPAEIS